MEPIKDLVSVIIPTYNRAHLIKRSAMSVLNQTYSNLELIIVDDGSTDNTEEVVKSIDDSRITYIKQPNQGACAARNNGIVHAQGEFIAFQDSDDVWHEDKLEKQLKCLKETGADLVFCCLNRIEDGKKVGFIGNNFKEGFIASSELPLGGSTQTLCADAKVFKDERFDIEMPRLQDFELLLRIKKKYKLYYVNEPLVDYYEQKDSISSKPDRLMKACDLLFAKHKDCDKQNLAMLVLSTAFRAKDNAYQNKVFSYVKSIYPSMRTNLRILAYRIGIWRLYQWIKSL